LSGTADPAGRIGPGGFAGGLADLLGVRVEEAHPLPAGATVTLSGGATGRVWSELVRPAGATTVTTYVDGPLAGQPAVTRFRRGRGWAWYVSTQLDDPDLDRLVRTVAGAAGVPVPAVGHPPGVELVRRVDGWLFAINHTGRAYEVDGNGPRLGPGGYAVVGPPNGPGDPPRWMVSSPCS
jgi:beta-galactosidase